MWTKADLVSLTLKINGTHHTIAVNPDLSLLRYLRDELGLVGTKNGCSTGHCGSCTVIIDGEAKRSCLVKLGTLQLGVKVIETIEALKLETGLHPIQQAFLATGAVQCGFCTPGMIMAAKALLDRNPNPTEEAIRQALRHNFCRCTGYLKIIQAVKLAAQVYITGQTLTPQTKTGGVGDSLGDIDGLEKVSGKLAFADDLQMAGMLYGQIVWAKYPHALLKKVETEQAAVQPGVQAVLTAKEVPGLNAMGFPKADYPVICGEQVKFTGDVVALVLAETPQQACRAAEVVQVEYEVLPTVDSWQKAATAGAIQLSENGNVCNQIFYNKGSGAAVFQAEDVVVIEGQFETPCVDHACMEPEAGLAYLDADGTIVIKAGTQQPFQLRRQISRVLALPEDNIRVVATPLGGGFGSKITHSIEALLALGVYCTRRPVKITLSRAESLRMSTKRHAFSMHYRLAANREGKVLGVEAKLVEDAGPYTGCSHLVLDQACTFAVGPYDIPNVKVEGWAYYTNNANGGAFRGFGINQANYAMETMLDILAEKLQLNPLELRLRNALEAGKSTLTGEILQQSVGIRATLEAAAQALKKELEVGSNHSDPYKKIGIGVAGGFKNVGTGKGNPDDGGAKMELNPNGRVLLKASVVEMGQGVRTALVQIAVQASGLDPTCIELITGDTQHTLPHFPAVGQRQTFTTGNAVVQAARDFRTAILAYIGRQYDMPEECLDLKGKTIYCYRNDTWEPVADLAFLSEKVGQGEITLQTSHYFTAPKTYSIGDEEARRTVPPEEYRNYPAYAYVTHVALVEVDSRSGEVKVRKIIAAHDVGVAINPRQIEGQIEGSCLMGLGYALKESYQLQEGYPRTNNLGQCHIPSILDAPEITTLIIEIPEPNGPFGAKGISEVATVPVTAAVLNAVHNACGVRTFSLPLTKDKLLHQLKIGNL